MAPSGAAALRVSCSRGRSQARCEQHQPQVRREGLLAAETRVQQSFYANDRCPTEYGVPLPDKMNDDVVAVEIAKWQHDTRAQHLIATTTLHDEQQAVHDVVTAAMDDATRETFAMFFLDGMFRMRVSAFSSAYR